MNYIRSYPGSALTYVSILLICTLCAILASSRRTKLSKVYVFLIVLLLSLFAGFRASTVGIDTSGYIYIFNILRDSFALKVESISDIGFLVLVKLIIMITGSVQGVLIVLAVLTNGLIIARLWSFRNNASFSYMVFLYITLFYSSTFSGIRQWVAIALVFYFTKHIRNKKYFKFIFWILVASTVHTTALIALLYIPLDILNSKKVPNKYRVGMFICILFSPVIILGLYFVVTKTSIISQYYHLLNSQYINVDIGWMFVIQLLILIFSLIFVKKKRIKINTEMDIIMIDKESQNAFIILYLMGFFLSLPGYFFKNVGRIGLYFTIFQVVFYANISKHERYGTILRIVTLFIAIYTFYIGLAVSGNGQMPYLPFWSN